MSKSSCTWHRRLVGWDRHDGHTEGLRKRLRRILQAEVHEEPNPDGTKPDGVITLQIGDARIAFLILELKRELCEGGFEVAAILQLKRVSA